LAYHLAPSANRSATSFGPVCDQIVNGIWPLAAEIGLPVWAPQQISPDFASCLRYCSDVAHRRPTELCTMFGRLLGWYTIYTFFEGSYPLTEFCHVQNSLYLQVSRSSILEALLHGSPAAGVSQTLRRGTRNGITELSQRAPPIFGWAPITLGIGPHSSSLWFTTKFLQTKCAVLDWLHLSKDCQRVDA